MIGYIIRRILVAIIITIGIAAITFELLHLIAGSPVHEVLGRGARPAQIAAWNKQHGYDRPLVGQFLTYLGHLGRLDFGYSYKQGQSVAAAVQGERRAQHLPVGVGARAVAADRDAARDRSRRSGATASATTR